MPEGAAGSSTGGLDGSQRSVGTAAGDVAATIAGSQSAADVAGNGLQRQQREGSGVAERQTGRKRQRQPDDDSVIDLT